MNKATHHFTSTTRNRLQVLLHALESIERLNASGALDRGGTTIVASVSALLGSVCVQASGIEARALGIIRSINDAPRATIEHGPGDMISIDFDPEAA